MSSAVIGVLEKWLYCVNCKAHGWFYKFGLTWYCKDCGKEYNDGS